jgi:transposase
LRWATFTTQARNSPHVKLNPARAKEIRRLMLAGFSKEDVARRFGVAPITVDYVARGRTWRVDPYKIVGGRPVALTGEELRLAEAELFPTEADL